MRMIPNAQPSRNALATALGWVAGGVVGMVFAATAAAGQVERVTDLQSLAAKGDGKATVIMFASRSCPYCDRAEQRFLGPMAEDPDFEGVNIRKVMLDRDEVRDFDGETMRGNELGRAYGVRVVPTIMAFDAEGQPVGRPLVGIPNEQLYRSQIRVRIDAARSGSRDTPS